jgi:uncharacterized protein
MGHCDSSARFGDHREVFGAGRRAAELDAARRTAVGDPHRGMQAEPAQGLHARSVGTWLLLFLVRVYKIFLSPFFGGACKFYPSCSNYAYEAIARHGARRGIVLAAKRLLRCRPFPKGGFDPVPEGEP